MAAVTTPVDDTLSALESFAKEERAGTASELEAAAAKISALIRALPSIDTLTAQDRQRLNQSFRETGEIIKGLQVFLHANMLTGSSIDQLCDTAVRGMFCMDTNVDLLVDHEAASAHIQGKTLDEKQRSIVFGRLYPKATQDPQFEDKVKLLYNEPISSCLMQISALQQQLVPKSWYYACVIM